MSKFSKHIGVFLILLLVFVSGVKCQTQKDLEAKKDAIQKELVYKSKLLEETKKNKAKSVQQVVLLNKKISTRERYIRTINREVRLFDKNILETEGQIKSLEVEIEELKEEYAQMIYYAYKNTSSYDKLMFVFSAEDFNQAYKRLMYYQQYAQYREQQTVTIKNSQLLLEEKIKELKIERTEKQALLNQEKKEKGLLSKEISEKKSVVSALQDDEKKLKSEINKKKKEAVKLQRAIKKMIADEIAKQKEEGEKALTPEALALSKGFSTNKSKLPWPVEKGEITGKFGTQQHPVLKNIKIQNNGIDIATTQGSMARAVFDGEVTRVMIIPGVGKVVMVRHGEYYTVYSNLKETFVQKGDKVTTKQEVGTVITDETKGVTEVHFEIWKGQTIMNPVDWIYKAK
jgi:septal ring factor EnvC (AmiA/AmiB activator)